MLGTRKPRDTVLISFAHRRGTARYCIAISSDESRNNRKSDRSHGSNYDIMTTLRANWTKRRMELNLRTSKEVEKTAGVVETCRHHSDSKSVDSILYGLLLYYTAV